jgi:uncharacterized protein YqeY
MTAMKSGEKDKANVYRLIKNEFLKFSTAKNAGELNEGTEINILQKMVKQREESITNYKAGNRMDLVENEQNEIDIINELLPAVPTEDDIKNYLATNYPNGVEKKSMGLVIKAIKEALVGADGKMVVEQTPEVQNGVIGDYLYIDGVKQRAYNLVKYDGAYYFISDGHKIVKNKTVYLTAGFVKGTYFAVGAYRFDGEGKMVLN